MCAPDKTEKRNKAFSYLFCTHLAICHGVRPLECHVKNGSFSSSSMNCVSMDSITEVICRLNKMVIATKHKMTYNVSSGTLSLYTTTTTKHIAAHNFVLVRQRNGTSCMQHSPNLSTSHFTALHEMQTLYSDENSVCPSVRLSVCLSHA